MKKKKRSFLSVQLNKSVSYKPAEPVYLWFHQTITQAHDGQEADGFYNMQGIKHTREGHLYIKKTKKQWSVVTGCDQPKVEYFPIPTCPKVFYFTYITTACQRMPCRID